MSKKKQSIEAELLTLENLPEKLDAETKEQFFDLFWKTWTSSGFGTLTKKDSDLLIFGCIRKALGKTAPKTNYEWAKLLRLTTSRVKALRLESYQRFSKLLGEDSLADLNEFLLNFKDVQSVDLNGFEKKNDIHQVMVSFVIEDPVVQMEIEYKLKSIGTYLDFHRNREVIKMRLIDFMQIASKDTELEAIEKWLSNKVSEQKFAEDLMARLNAKGYANKSETEKLSCFIDDLAKQAGVPTLINHMKTIFASQKERK